MFGTGPSLNEAPQRLLDKLWQFHTFATNDLLDWNKLTFSPNFHGLSEQELMTQLDRFTRPAHRKLRRRFACHQAPIQHPAWQWVAKAPDDVQIQTHGMVGLADDLPPLPTGRATPLTLGVQLGAWMGFDPIYLLGCDNSRLGSVLDPEKKRDRVDLAPVVRAAEGCRQAMERVGRTLIDCTPNGGLNEVLPYQPLEEVL